MLDLEAKPDPLKIAGLIIGLLLFALAGWWVLKPENRIPGILGMSFGVLGLFVTGYRLLFCRPAILISMIGFESRWWGIPFVSWSEIDSLRISQFRSKELLSIAFRHPEQIYRRMGRISRAWWKLNQALGYGHVAISSGGLEPSVGILYSHAVRFVSPKAG